MKNEKKRLREIAISLRGFSVQKLPREANKVLPERMEDNINQKSFHSKQINSKSQLNAKVVLGESGCWKKTMAERERERKVREEEQGRVKNRIGYKTQNAVKAERLKHSFPRKMSKCFFPL